MWLPKKAQVDAAARHAITAVSVAITIFGLQAKGVSMDQVTVLINSLGSTINTLVQLVAAAGIVYGGIKASKTASPTSQIAAVKVIAQDNSQVESPDAKVALLNATASVLSDPKTSPNSPELKAALIDATAALPEVVGNINVTDESLVQNTHSNQVVKTEGLAA